MQDKLILKEGLANTTSEIKAKMDKMESLFAEVKGETAKLKDFWESPSGAVTQVYLSELVAAFDDINIKNAEYVTFLNEMVQKYSDLDGKISAAVNTAAGTGL